MRGIRLAEAGLIPDFLVRRGIRRMLAERLQSLRAFESESFVEGVSQSPIALVRKNRRPVVVEVTEKRGCALELSWPAPCAPDTGSSAVC